VKPENKHLIVAALNRVKPAQLESWKIRNGYDGITSNEDLAELLIVAGVAKWTAAGLLGGGVDVKPENKHLIVAALNRVKPAQLKSWKIRNGYGGITSNEDLADVLIAAGVAKWTAAGLTDMKEETFQEKEAEILKREGSGIATLLVEYVNDGMTRRGALLKYHHELNERAWPENHGARSVQGKEKKGQAQTPHITLKCEFADRSKEDRVYKTTKISSLGDVPRFQRASSNGAFLYHEVEKREFVSAIFVGISLPSDWKFRHDLLEPDASWVDGGSVVETVLELASEFHKSFEQYRIDRIGYGLYQKMMNSPVHNSKPRRYWCPLCVAAGNKANVAKNKVFEHLETRHEEVKFKQSKEEQN
jgi:hypothetical protein